MLKVIDNPLQDIPLVTVLRSMIGGFTDNELLEIRLKKQKVPFFKALQKASEDYEKEIKCNDVSNQTENELQTESNQNCNAKARRFIKMLDAFKKDEKKLPLDELIWKIYSDTGYYHYVRLMPNGSLRQANLKKLFEKAKDYEKISFKGLFNFITFIEKVAAKPSGMQEAKIIGENDDVVRIMSIHKSKGLEFKICFLCEVEKKINLRDLAEKIIYDQELGLGINYISDGIEYPTLSKEAIKIKVKNESISEEMRVLYVALTRAKEKLIIVGTDKKIEESLEKKKAEIYKYHGELRPEKMNPKLVEKYVRYLDWIELVYLYNNGANINLEIINKSDLPNCAEEQENIDVKSLLESKQMDQRRYNEVDELLNWKYSYEEAIEAPSKTSVTALKQEVHGSNDTFIENRIQSSKNEDFENRINESNKIKGAKLGTLIHLALQKTDIKTASNLYDLIDSLKIAKEEKEALEKNRDILESYIKSDLYKDLQKAKKVYREVPFYMDIPYKETGEKVLVQGIIDLYYESEDGKIVLVDYKTDRNVTEKELKTRYEFQLSLYKEALEKALKTKVDKVYIYSTYLNNRIEILKE